jgi:tRNA-modifying protein YgfZ
VAILDRVVAIDTVPAGRLASEHATLTEACGLVDRSERGKLALSGPEAKTFLAGQVTNDVEALEPGGGCYAAFLTHKGKMLGDLRVLDVNGADMGEPGLGEELLLDTERSALQALFDMIRRFQIGYELELHKRTLERGLLSLIGPDADRLAGTAPSVANSDAADGHARARLGAEEHSNMAVSIDDIEALAVRTDVGVDLICAAGDTDALAQTLRKRGAEPVSEEAAEIVRVERGRPRYGVDLDGTVIPQEAGLNERAVSFTKGCYVGQETVARLHYKGKPNRQLRGLCLSAPGSPAGAVANDGAAATAVLADAVGAELRLGERQVGRLTSVALSPDHGPIGLALIRREAEPGASLSVGESEISAEVVELPFDPAAEPGPEQRGADT